MKSYQEALTANVAVTFPIAGSMFYLKESSGGEVVDVELVRNYAESNKIERVGKGFRMTPAEPFEGVKLRATANTTIEFIITDGDVDIWFSEDELIIGNDDAQSIPVKTPVGAPLAVQTEAGDYVEVRTNPANPLDVLFAGTVEPVLGVVTVDNTNAEAVPVQQQALTVIDDKAPVTVGVAATALVSDATLKRLRIRNSHATAIIAIGGAGVTLANGAVQLEPGDMFVEEDAAGAAWYAISDTADTIVQVQGLK